MLPRLAIIGRPNVGKSSLFNRLAGRRISIVDPTPGVTRDRISAAISIRPARGPARSVEVVDTGGWGVYTTDKNRIDDAGKDLARLTPDIEFQIMAAAEAAHVILFTIDARDGLLPLDRTVADLLRKRGLAKRVMLVANKVDDGSLESTAQEAARLGFGAPVCVSAQSGNGLQRLRDLVCRALPRKADDTDDPEPGTDLRVAIVGRRNAGKSSLVNQLAGEPRVIVSEIAGTTRDSVDVRIQMQDRVITLIDTAGVRKRKSWDGDIEFYANTRTDDAIARCDVAWLLLDATEKSAQIEKQLAGQLGEAFKPALIVVNKWDLVQRKLTPADYQEYLTQEFPGLAFAPIVFVSAKTGLGLREAVGMSFSLRDQAAHREGTGRVNAAVRRILEERGPSSKLGSKAKVFYVSQIGVNPPTIAMVVNKPELFEGRYERYFLNRLREELPFSEVPIKLQFSARRRWQDGEGGGSPDAPAEAPVRERSEPRARGGREERSPRGPRGASRRQPAGARTAGAKRAGKKPARTGRSGPGKRTSR
ncbi:MAG: ribosome biogenesis GTPase Der [Planctomycetota bacterium]